MIPNRSKPQLLAEWSELVNMTAAELEEFLAAPEGKVAGLTRTEAARQGIRSGQDSARAILRMKRKDPSEWSWQDWDWAQRQVAFIRRMSAMRGPLYDAAGRPTRKLLSLMLWGHLPVEASDEPATVRGGTAFASNHAAHPLEQRSFRSNAFSGEDIFAEFVEPEEPAGPPPPLSDLRRDDEIQIGRNRYIVVSAWDNFNVTVKKPGAKRKMFFVRQEDDRDVAVREQRGSEEATLAGPILSRHPLSEVRKLQLEPNRAAHPFRSVEVEREMLRRSSSESERARLRQHRYAVAGIDSRGRDWSLGTFADLNDALRRAASQSRYPRAAVFDVATGEMVH